MNLQTIGIKYKQGNVILPRKALLKFMEELLTKAPECLELAVLYVAIRDGKSLEEVMEEIEAETNHLTGNETMRKRLIEAIRSKEWLPWEDVKERLALFSPQAFKNLVWWIKYNRKVPLKIAGLVEECLRHPFKGSGKA